MISDVYKATTAVLEAELELYREALGAENEVPALDSFKNNNERKEAVLTLQGAHGTPVRVDSSFKESTLGKLLLSKGENLEDGEVFFVAAEEISEAKAIEAEAKSPKDEPTDVEPTPTTPLAPDSPQPTGDLVYQGKTVVRTSNVILSGKTYKDVFMATGETYRITVAEFNRDVTPRKN